jgi:tetratricopeptide (TPR) repeat protein
MEWLNSLVDMSLLITIGVIFLVTLIGSHLRFRRKDPCLCSFEGYHVTLEQTDDKVVWGVLTLESTGLELLYKKDVQDEAHLESSYILYGSEYDKIQAIYRYADQMDAVTSVKRARDIDRSFHPGPWERIKRTFRNFISTAGESINEVIGLVVGRAKRPVGRYITDTGENYLNQLGTNLIGHVGGAYDPLLERYIGQKVVIELQEDDEVHEHVGIFKNYSPDFLEILDLQYPERKVVELPLHEHSETNLVQVSVQNGRMIVSNHKSQPLLVHALEVDDSEELLNVIVNSGESIDLFPETQFTKAKLHVRTVRELDLVVPRIRCVIRHRAERFKPDILPDIIFDVGILLNSNRRQMEQERRLRTVLEKNPKAALAAANLGMLLLQRQQYEEARKWLRHALHMRYSLPDNGRRADMELRELNRRLYESQPAYLPSQPAPMAEQEDHAEVQQVVVEMSDIPLSSN